MRSNTRANESSCPSRRQSLVCAWPILAIVLLVGCSESAMTEVTGRVTFNDKPVEYGVISFWPADGRGPSAQEIIQGGKYALEVPPGAKKVGIEAMEKAGEQPLPGSDTVIPVYKTVSPERYRKLDQTSLQCEISPQSNVQDFHLKSP